jgi:hypothetical protein
MLMLNNQKIFVLLGMALVVPVCADDFQVDTPDIEDGKWAVNTNLSYGFDGSADHDNDNYLSHVDGLSYGINDQWEVAGAAAVEKNSGGPQKLTNLRLEGKFVPYKAGSQWFDWGLGFEFDKAVPGNKPNNLEAKLLLQKNIGNWNNAANILLSRQLGPDQKGTISGGLALLSKYQFNEKFGAGVEYYGDYGPLTHMPTYTQQGHVVGPVFQGQLGPIAYDTGVLFGLSHNTPDTTFKLNLEYGF